MTVEEIYKKQVSSQRLNEIEAAWLMGYIHRMMEKSSVSREDEKAIEKRARQLKKDREKGIIIDFPKKK